MGVRGIRGRRRTRPVRCGAGAMAVRDEVTCATDEPSTAGALARGHVSFHLRGPKPRGAYSLKGGPSRPPAPAGLGPGGGTAQGRRQSPEGRWDPACGPMRSIPPSTTQDAPVV